MRKRRALEYERAEDGVLIHYHRPTAREPSYDL
eukprot:CAMPEP_0119117590 /NCGR_PEP_ID=MMETSP1180-20130426/52926_1 /TAXON_ID=3052 ORGANISM="Chlamydomonas cf sp, Strain CCMP681" /NCGR_SAMPLE_ID=MMETSP1180 /ASSEMBLY_ACC=CAM_ASM_000741 /LENGTH=32 /DNA_ID= /DNA_START= /DNA_END= /DNA_ORIENTATION=